MEKLWTQIILFLTVMSTKLFSMQRSHLRMLKITRAYVSTFGMPRRTVGPNAYFSFKKDYSFQFCPHLRFIFLKLECTQFLRAPRSYIFEFSFVYLLSVQSKYEKIDIFYIIIIYSSITVRVVPHEGLRGEARRSERVKIFCRKQLKTGFLAIFFACSKSCGLFWLKFESFLVSIVG